jgi:hypothetical protein
MDRSTKHYLIGIQTGINLAVFGMSLWFHNGDIVMYALMGNLLSAFIWMIIIAPHY